VLFFFGREKEAENLYEALSGVKHLLVYGPSGAGKTSLIECGLRNQFADADWLALSIRRGNNIISSVYARINDALKNKITIAPESNLPKEKIDFEKAIEQLFDEKYKPVYLLFDQFEELLISGSNVEKQDFFERLNQLIQYKIPCCILLIMREEFIGHLSEFENLCPSIFKYRYRLEKMREYKVGSVIESMLKAPAYQKFYTINDSKALAKEILRKLTYEKQEIELTHLQVFLSELWDRAKKEASIDETPLLHSKSVKVTDNLEGVLTSFLKKQLLKFDEKYGVLHALEVLDSMITERHTKLPMSERAIAHDLQNKEVQVELSKLLKDLKRNRLIRTLKAGKQIQYEISHDLLALAVGQSLPEGMQKRRKAMAIYKLYVEEKDGLLSPDELIFLAKYKPYKRYPDDLKKKIEKSKSSIKKLSFSVQSEEEFLKKKEKEKAKIGRQRIMTGFILLTLTFFLVVVLQQRINKNNTLVELNQASKDIDDTLVELNQEKEKKKKIIDASYFYEDKFGLAYKNDKFGFINKDGKLLIDYKYNSARQFDYLGLAKVTKEKDEEVFDYLLDTSGVEFKAAYQFEHLDGSIEALDLGTTEFDNFPKKILENTQLKILMLDDNRLTLPTTIGKLKNLKHIDLDYNKIDTLPLQLFQMENLRTLSLSDNLIAIIPSEIWQLKNLNYLDLFYNKLSTLPATIGQLKSLRVLDLSYNQLCILPEELWQLKNLTKLYLNSIQLSSLPKSISQLEKLKEIDLYGNQINTLPVEITQLKNLQKLDLSYNQLRTLPLEFGQLKSLRVLHLAGNNFSSLPVEIGELENLKKLNLRNNQLSTLPLEILNKLDWLDLSGNNFNEDTIKKLKDNLPYCKIIFEKQN